MTCSNDINSANITDIHFGHPHLDPERLCKKLIKQLKPIFVNIQILFVCGDLFDRMLFLDHPAAYWALLFLRFLFTEAKQRNVKLRFLRGTYTHDRNQQRIIDGMHITGVDYKVISEIYIETIKNWNNNSDRELKVLYLPDSLPHKNSVAVYNKIKELFALVGWDKCDLVIGHGTFEHCLPPNVKLPACHYTTEAFKDITSGKVIMGHIHVPSHKDNVIYVGSFDRMAHGEEERKGFLLGNFKDGKWTFHFKENTEATLFYTVAPKGNTKDQLIEDALSRIEKLFPDKIGNLRIIHSDAEFKSIILNICNSRYPNIRVTFKTDTINKAEMQLDESDICTDVEFDILNVETITAHIVDKLSKDGEYNSYNFTQEDIYAAIADLF